MGQFGGHDSAPVRHPPPNGSHVTGRVSRGTGGTEAFGSPWPWDPESPKVSSGAGKEAPECSTPSGSTETRELWGLGQATPRLPGGSPAERPGPLVSPGEAGNNPAPSRVTRGHPQGACKAGPSRPSSRQGSREGAPRLPDDGSKAQTRPSSGAAKAPPSHLGRRAGDSVTGGRAGPSPPEHRRVMGVAGPPPAPTRADMLPRGCHQGTDATV